MRNWYVTHDYTNNRLGFTRLPGSSLPAPKNENESWSASDSSSGSSSSSSSSGGSSSSTDIPTLTPTTSPTKDTDEEDSTVAPVVDIPVTQDPTTMDYVNTGLSIGFSA
eukprot:CAMPEP_0185614802 /NCGR_PEP_ID=MMETSP0436-20130131/33365_1 /TAXON_ID=626734 ORGANISM="Favella taraikaensis, Strain Fe Narragansett Bay" /NCGR_SAMPLE_ID=MMETSP0436 /ASSEMBLY_ACC=CAM_ASM_000390 /LENGTH=108 /DNA_ID=CAMNT_0028249987 /DNA_START=495 /DNA_END=818 /DNA_ORIENTATION=-